MTLIHHMITQGPRSRFRKLVRLAFILIIVTAVACLVANGWLQHHWPAFVTITVSAIVTGFAAIALLLMAVHQVSQTRPAALQPAPTRPALPSPRQASTTPSSALAALPAGPVAAPTTVR